MQLQQQLQISTAAGALPPVTDAAPSAEVAAAADSERRTVAAEEPAGAQVMSSVNPDNQEGVFPLPTPHPPCPLPG